MNKLILIIISVACFLFVKEEEKYELYNPSKEIIQQSKFKQVEFGFNLGYLARIKSSEVALNKISSSGQFKYIRIYEPFGRTLYNNFDDIYSKINQITSKGFTLLISLSDYPYESEVKSDINEKYEYEGLNDEAIEKIYRYSNRYPPADLNKYKVYLNKFLSGLQNKNLLDKVYFEIGNEPDSKKYFWGTPEQFEEIRNETVKILNQYNTKIICCGYTASLLTSTPDDRRKKYIESIKRKNSINHPPLSFHIYFNSNNQNRDFDTITSTYIKNGTITEYGIFSKITDQTVNKNKIYNSSEYMYWFGKLLNFTYKNDILRVFLWKLADDPSQKGMPGYFDGKGYEKENYRYLNIALDVIKDGYYVETDDSKLKITGKNKTILIALKPIELDNIQSSTYSEVAKIQNKSIRLTEKNWIIYNNK
ncbi:MAG: hypothetical protein J7604_03660 [Sporocytophaga sp.]|uniref:hypothetical protein n=1 Tax=Sporocytophaga sp. TaxID=2231183 RepID=UPI001B26C689|nr:hypothetical protein [Sporocytophaga sp.]MBO9699278.1 hypothetical protein [Sporocytophaga sp.]